MTVVTAAGLGLVTLGAPASPVLETLARDAAVALEGRPAEEIAKWATDTFGARFCVTSSDHMRGWAFEASTRLTEGIASVIAAASVALSLSLATEMFPA